MKIDTKKKYYIGDNKENTVEFKVTTVHFLPISHKIDGVLTVTHSPIHFSAFRLDHLQCRHLGNTWSEGSELFSTYDNALEIEEKNIHEL